MEHSDVNESLVFLSAVQYISALQKPSMQAEVLKTAERLFSHQDYMFAVRTYLSQFFDLSRHQQLIPRRVER